MMRCTIGLPPLSYSSLPKASSGTHAKCTTLQRLQHRLLLWLQETNKPDDQGEKKKRGRPPLQPSSAAAQETVSPNEYEAERLEKIKENSSRMQSLGLKEVSGTCMIAPAARSSGF